MELLIGLTIIIAGVIIWQMVRQKSVATISFEQFMTDATYQDYQRIDVRTKQEFKSGHLTKFKNIPLDKLATQLSTIDQNRPVAVMCASGMRSAQAAKLLHQHNYQVVNLRGGIHAAPKNFK